MTSELPAVQIHYRSECLLAYASTRTSNTYILFSSHTCTRAGCRQYKRESEYNALLDVLVKITRRATREIQYLEDRQRYHPTLYTPYTHVTCIRCVAARRNVTCRRCVAATRGTPQRHIHVDGAYLLNAVRRNVTCRRCVAADRGTSERHMYTMRSCTPERHV